MGGSFHSQGRGFAWKRDDVAEQQRAQLKEQKVADYTARVVGHRVRVVADLDYGREGTVVGVVAGLLSVHLDGEDAPHRFDRFELQAAQ